MKNYILILCILGICETTSAQWTTSGSDIYNTNSGNVGIGTITPTTPLDVRKDYDGGTFITSRNANNSTSAYAGFAGRAQNQCIQLNALSDALSRSYPGFHSSSTMLYASASNGLNIISDVGTGSIGANTGTIRFITYSGSGGITSNTSGNDTFTRMVINASGNVDIGTTDPQDYKLAVNGNMIAESVKVKLHANWPDYVFHKNYSLKPLSEIEQYIKTNQHLPEIPSTEEVKKDGLDLGEMNAKLLQKIEELTLYLIEKDKQVTDLRERMKMVEGKRQKNKK